VLHVSGILDELMPGVLEEIYLLLVKVSFTPEFETQLRHQPCRVITNQA